MVVDSWIQTTSCGSSLPNSTSPLPIYSGSAFQLHNPMDIRQNGHHNLPPNNKSLEVDGQNSRVTRRARNESDPIDRGVVPADALHCKVESIENALDQVYFKMKTELRDVRDSLKTLNRHSESSSDPMSPLPPITTDSHSYLTSTRALDRIDV